MVIMGTCLLVWIKTLHTFTCTLQIMYNHLDLMTNLTSHLCTQWPTSVPVHVHSWTDSVKSHGTGLQNLCWSQVWVATGRGGGMDFPTRELQNKPKIIQNSSVLSEL